MDKFVLSGRVLIGMCLLAFGLQDSLGQTVLLDDDFDPSDCSNPTDCSGTLSCGGAVDHSTWLVVPGFINGYTFAPDSLPGSDPCHQKNHTGSPDGSMSDVSTGGSAFEVDNNPRPYGVYRDFGGEIAAIPGYRSQDLRLSGWVWDDVEVPLCNPYPVRIGGGIGLTAAPGNAVTSSTGCTGGNGQHEIYPYADYAFLGIESDLANSDPDANYYKWRTRADESPDGSVKWHLAIDPATGLRIPRRPILQCPHTGPQTWKHLEIVVHPYTGDVGDIEFYIDGVLVGQGRRQAVSGCQGVDLQRVHLGARFPEQSDIDACKPPYSYEHLWFDDVSLTLSSGPLPCVNPELRYDTDGDDDVDMVDFATFQRCYTPSLPDCSCRCMDSNGDGAIDQTDLQAFLDCASGEGVPADVSCETGLTPP